MFSKFEYDGKLNPTFVEGPFQLPLSSIRAYLKEPITPRFHVLFFFFFRTIFQGQNIIDLLGALSGLVFN